MIYNPTTAGHLKLVSGHLIKLLQLHVDRGESLLEVSHKALQLTHIQILRLRDSNHEQVGTDLLLPHQILVIHDCNVEILAVVELGHLHLKFFVHAAHGFMQADLERLLRPFLHLLEVDGRHVAEHFRIVD